MLVKTVLLPSFVTLKTLETTINSTRGGVEGCYQGFRFLNSHIMISLNMYLMTVKSQGASKSVWAWDAWYPLW